MAGKIRVIKLADFGVSSYCHVKHQGLQMMWCGVSILMDKFASLLEAEGEISPGFGHVEPPVSRGCHSDLNVFCSLQL